MFTVCSETNDIKSEDLFYMKKKIFAILLVVAMVASLAVGFTACNRDDNNVEKPSNAETLGTAIAVASGINGGAASAAGEVEANAGLELSFGTGLIDKAASAAYSIVKPAVDEFMANTIDSVSCYVNESGFKVEKGECDKEEFNEMYVLTVSYTDENGEAAETVYRMYISAKDKDGNFVDMNTATEYTFTAELYVKDGDEFVKVTSFSGNAKFDATVNATKFGVYVGVDGTGVGVEAYATETGSIVIAVDVDVNNIFSGTTVDVKVELGKLADNKYGAKVNVDVVTNSCTVNVEANVIASGAEEANEFAVNGSVKVNVVNTCTVEAQISGTAKYVKATEDAESELVLSLQGNATVSATENNE